MRDEWDAVLRARQDDPAPWLVVPRNPVHSHDHSTYSYAWLAERSRAVAAGLSAVGVKRGEPVLILCDNTVDSCVAILAVLRAGLTVVPVAPARLGQDNAIWVASVEARAQSAGARVMVAHADLEAACVAPASLRIFSVDALASSNSRLGWAPDAADDELAIIQFTSGTTSAARAVELTHANVFANLRAIGETVEVAKTDVVGCWLPLFHDMGLIGSFLFSTFHGLPLVLLTPRSFILRPEAWLWSISRFGVTLGAAPSSAYALCTKRIASGKLHGLDLSSWRVAINGGELIQPAVMADFRARFAAHGFRSEALRPTYGLAENTVAVSMMSASDGPECEWVDAQEIEAHGEARPCSAGGRRAREVVCVGRAITGHAMRVVGADDRELPDRQVGAIQVFGPSSTRHVRGEQGSSTNTHDGWIRTGDRGYLVAGRLFVVGRDKQVVKVGGQAIDAAYLETVIRTELQFPTVAVFGSSQSGEGERLVILAESARRTSAEARLSEAAIEALVRRHAGVTPEHIGFVALGSIPRTSSGKIKHGEARRLFEQRTS